MKIFRGKDMAERLLGYAGKALLCFGVAAVVFWGSPQRTQASEPPVEISLQAGTEMIVQQGVTYIAKPAQGEFLGLYFDDLFIVTLDGNNSMDYSFTGGVGNNYQYLQIKLNDRGRLSLYLYTYIPGAVNVSGLQVGAVLHAGDWLSIDQGDSWVLNYFNSDGSDRTSSGITGICQVETLYGKTQWTITSINGKTINLDEPQTPPALPDPEPAPEPVPQPDPEPVPQPEEKSGASCHHELEWEVQKEASSTTAGLMYYKCTKCGFVEQTLETSGYPVFLKNTCEAVKTAAANATVSVDTNIWTSFTQSVIDALAARPDVTLNVTYKYEGKYYTTAIPAGADLSGLVNEDGYCGFRYLDQVFGGSEIVR